MLENIDSIVWYDKDLAPGSVFSTSILQGNFLPPISTPASIFYGDPDDNISHTYDFSPTGWFDSSLIRHGLFDFPIVPGVANPPPVVIPGFPVTPKFKCKNTLLDLAETFRTENRPIVQLLEPEEILAQLILATEYFDGYAELEEHREGIKSCPRITAATTINESEKALIWPLFLLYLERESVLYAEASRGLGLDSFIRPSSEIAQDIQLMQSEFPHMAFYCDIVNL